MSTKKTKENKITDKKEDSIREVIVEKKVGFSNLEVIIIMIIAVIFGGLIGSAITYTKETNDTSSVSSELSELVSTYDNIADNYYNKVDKNKLLDSAVKGMIEYLNDPYSTYMDEVETQSFNQTVGGNYYGIGATVSTSDGKVVIIDMFANSPAKKAGLKIGDQFVSIDDVDISGKTVSEVTDLIKGEEGTMVKIKMLRDGSPLEFTLTRSKIDIPSVTSKVLEKNGKRIGYIYLDIFASNTYSQFKSNLEKLEKKNIESLIIDVRSNPGGHLTQVSKILSLFLPKNKIMYQIKSKGVKEPIYSLTKDKKNYKVAVLINSSSASASEILAAGLQESYGATVVGTKSYGKGTVQKAYSLSSGASFKYTTEEWLTPKAKSINNKGITPDVVVELSDEYKNNPTDDTDNQLQTALDILTK